MHACTHAAPGCSSQPPILSGVKTRGRACSDGWATRPGMCLHIYACRAEVKQWEQRLAASRVQLQSKTVTFRYMYRFTPIDKQILSTCLITGVSHTLLAVRLTLLSPVLVLELMQFVLPLLLLQLLFMTLLLNLPLVLQQLLLVLECQ